MKKIPLGKSGKFALVDDQDYTELSRWKWHLHIGGYAVRKKWVNGKRPTCYMHREIIKAPKGTFTDHVNLIKLDNRRENLRVCSATQNGANRGKFRVGGKPTLSRYKGVTYSKKDKKWRAQIMLNYKNIALGSFDCEIEAAKAYDKKATELFGDFKRNNNV